MLVNRRDFLGFVAGSAAAVTAPTIPNIKAVGVSALNVPGEEILFVAFAGWDAAGAKQFGYPTYCVNRQQLPPEELGVLPDASAKTLRELAMFLG